MKKKITFEDTLPYVRKEALVNTVINFHNP
jgi:hypothetical protein